MSIPGNRFSNFPLASPLSLFFVSATPKPNQIYYLLPKARRQLLCLAPLVEWKMVDNIDTWLKSAGF